jgi:sortase B
MPKKTAENGQDDISSIVASTTAATNEDASDNPIDFEDLQKKNSDIYAWIKVPGTKVDYPVVQSSESDELYLKHSAIDKSWIASGAIYSERVNTKTFRDRVTLLYGHNGYSDTMFTTLHKFEKKDFFDNHEYFYIYTPSSKLTYKIVSAFKYDDRHIMNSFDFQNDKVFLEFLDMIQNPVSNNKNVCQNIDRNFTIDDNIVVLSTCITNQKSSRYLVCGVLEKNEKTN